MAYRQILKNWIGVLAVSACLTASSCFPGPRIVETTYVPPAPQPVYQMPPPPPWAPEYPRTYPVRYYYLPDMECYYDVSLQQYVYFDGSLWVHNGYPPPYYGDYDMNGAYVVVLDQHVNDPWNNHTTYVNNYPRGSYERGNRSPGSENQPRRGYNENDRTVLIPARGARSMPVQTPVRRGPSGPQVPVRGQEPRTNEHEREQERTREQDREKEQERDRERTKEQEQNKQREQEQNKQREHEKERNGSNPRDRESDSHAPEIRNQSPPPSRPSENKPRQAAPVKKASPPPAKPPEKKRENN